MSKTEGQVKLEIKAIDTKCKEILKHLDVLKKEGIYDEKYIGDYADKISDFHKKFTGSDGFESRSKNYFKAQKENKK